MGIEIYAGGRHCGKTAWIIEKSSRIGIPIAVVSARHSVEIMKLAKDMGMKSLTLFSFRLILLIRALDLFWWMISMNSFPN